MASDPVGLGVCILVGPRVGLVRMFSAGRFVGSTVGLGSVGWAEDATALRPRKKRRRHSFDIKRGGNATLFVMKRLYDRDNERTDRWSKPDYVIRQLHE